MSEIFLCIAVSECACVEVNLLVDKCVAYIVSVGFLRKVYGIVSAQLLITTAVAAVFLTFEPLRLYLSHTWLYVHSVSSPSLMLCGLRLFVTVLIYSQLHQLVSYLQPASVKSTKGDSSSTYCN